MKAVNKNLEIEYLRAVSICMVLAAHSVLFSPFIGDWLMPLFGYLNLGIGVDLFFCISGYVVSRSYLVYFDQHVQRGAFWPAARAFWKRRAYRLLPSAWLWVGIGTVCSLYFNRSEIFLDVAQNLKSALAIFSFTANIAHMYGGLAPNNVYWSLSLEEQFYLLFPLFLLLVTSGRGRVMGLLVLIAVQFSLSRNHFGDLTEQYAASFRTEGFAWGILIHLFSRSALYLKVEPQFLGRFKPLALLVTLVLLYLLAAVPALLSSFAISMGLMAMVAASLVWLASYGKGYLFGYSDRLGVMAWLGSRSYGIYLIHMPAFRIVHELTVRYLLAVEQPYSVAVVPFLLVGWAVLLVLLAELNYRYIEAPLRRLGAERSRNRQQVEPNVMA